MMAKAPPQFNFYYNDWLGGVAPLTPHQEQCYLRLLIQQWQDGFIPLTKASRMAVCNVTDEGLWDSIWNALRGKFSPFDLDETTVAFRNERMHEDREKAIRVWKQRVLASKKGGKSRKKNKGAERLPERIAERVAVSDKDTDKDKDTSSLNTKKKKECAEPQLARLPDELRQAAETWIEYKHERGERYRPTGLKSFVTHLLKRAPTLGDHEIKARIERAMANGWRGWDHERPPSEVNNDPEFRL